MAKKTRKKRRNEFQIRKPWVEALSLVFDLFGRIIDRFGWAGAILLAGYLFVVRYASPEQKREIVDVFVLGKGISQYYLIGIMVAMWALTFIAQDRIWRRTVKIKDDEIDRLSEWKSEHQREKIGEDRLHRTPKRGGK